MASPEELRRVRSEKLNLLKENGINPYPSSTNRTHKLSDVISNFDTLEKSSETIRVSGRVMSIRGQGAILFIDLFDGYGRFQVVLKKDNSPLHENYDGDGFKLFVDTIDVYI